MVEVDTVRECALLCPVKIQKVATGGVAFRLNPAHLAKVKKLLPWYKDV